MSHNSSPRRAFLSSVGLGGTALALPTVAWGATSNGGLDPVDKEWDLSWTRRINGKYRAVFDAPAVGPAATRAMMWHSQYRQVFGLAASKLSAVVVVRHLGISMVMNDAFWDEFNLNRPIGRGAQATTTTDTTAAAGHGGNPNRAAIEEVIAAGGVVLACNVAFSSMASRYHDADARTRAIAHLIPGVILQPSGPFALMRAQDAGCHYMQAS